VPTTKPYRLLPGVDLDGVKGPRCLHLWQTVAFHRTWYNSLILGATTATNQKVGSSNLSGRTCDIQESRKRPVCPLSRVTLDAHIALDKLRQCEQRRRSILHSAQKGEYTRHAFWESVQDVLTELYLCDPGGPLGEVAQQLPE
jgi:hypothetical protein